MLDYRAETFLVVCQEMNFTKAAQRLGITQPAVSNQIRQLEEHYDSLLFGYEGKRIYMTREGKMLYEALVSMHNNEINLRQQLRNAKEEREELRFGVTHMVGEYMISGLLAQYISKHPSAAIHMHMENTENLLHQLEAGIIDFAILEGKFRKMDYESRLYSTEAFIGVCSPYNTFAGKQVLLTKLLSERVIAGEKASDTRELLENALFERNVNLTDFAGAVELSGTNTIKELVMQNLGIAFLYEPAVRQELAEGTLMKLNIKGWNIRHEICAVWKKDHPFSDYYEKLLRELAV